MAITVLAACPYLLKSCVLSQWYACHNGQLESRLGLVFPKKFLLYSKPIL